MTVHVLFSVGWFDAVLVYLALGATVLLSSDAATVRAA